MDMSKACLPPNQPVTTTAEEQHPLFREYQQYRAAMSRQLVTASAFALWLEQTEKNERGSDTVYEVTASNARLAQGWWKNVFGPGRHLLRQLGPFTTEAEATAA